MLRLHFSPRLPFALTPLAFSLLAALTSVPAAQAQAVQPPEDAPPLRSSPLPQVTATATRTERAVDDVPATVTVVDTEQLRRSDARDLKDLLASEVDVAVPSGAPRFTAAGGTGRAGQEGINIRGLQGNQVLMLVDGIRVPNAFSFGPFATGRGDYVDLDVLSTVDLLRGPSSSQYGSDGLGGAVALTTLRPQDLLKKDQTFAGTARLGYQSVDHSWHTSVALARRSGGLSGLLVVSHRRGHETDTQGTDESRSTARTAPNPLDHESTTVLGRLQWRLSPAHELGVTVEGRRREQQVDVLSAIAADPTPTSQTASLKTDDTLRRRRVSVDHRFEATEPGFLTQLSSQLYWQDARVSQFSAEDRALSADRTRDNTYQERVVGFSTLGQARIAGPLRQRLSFGLDASQTDLHGVRDGTVPPFGETFPAKPFPDTRYRLAGAFVQSEIEAGQVSVLPALRFDHYSLDPSASGFVGTAVSLSDQAVTPRLGLIWRLSDHLAPYVQASRGFRAPTPDQVNNGFTNAASGYTSIGNPSLKAERARSLELGARGEAGPVRWHLAAFDNRYQDFISQEWVSGSFTPADPAVFQYVNLAEARIRGAELRLEMTPATGWTAQFALAHARGDSEVDGVSTPLDSVAPLRSRLSLRYDAGRWSVGGQWLHADAKPARRLSDPGYFAPPASDVFDLQASLQLTPALRLQAAVLNLLDETYWRWSDVQGLSSASPVLAAYTAPGRSLQVSLRADF